MTPKSRRRALVVEDQGRLLGLEGGKIMAEQELMLRRELADLTNQTRREQSETNAATRMAATAMQTSAKKQAARPKQSDIPNFRNPQ